LHLIWEDADETSPSQIPAFGRRHCRNACIIARCKSASMADTQGDREANIKPE
jgi:hypothetical protein